MRMSCCDGVIADSWSSGSVLSSQVGSRVSGWLSHVVDVPPVFGLPLPPLFSPWFTLFLSFTPPIPQWLTRVSVMSLTDVSPALPHISI